MTESLLYWQALNRALDIEMATDESVFVLGEDVGLYGGSYRVTQGLRAKYGDWRERDTPISEGGFTGLGVGAALTGMRPVHSQPTLWEPHLARCLPACCLSRISVSPARRRY